MRRPESSDGFLVCFLLNMLWEAGWGIATLILLLLRLTAGLPSTWWRLAMAAWMLVAFVKTGLIEWVSRTSSERDPEKPNKNPYSVEGRASLRVDRPAEGPAPAAETAAPDEIGLKPEGALSAPDAAPDEIRLWLDSAPAQVDLEKLNAALDELKAQTAEEQTFEETAQGQTAQMGGY